MNCDRGIASLEIDLNHAVMTVPPDSDRMSSPSIGPDKDIELVLKSLSVDLKFARVRSTNGSVLDLAVT
jgi:hypothetical protein